MGNLVKATVIKDKVLIAYLDLCGTKFAYSYFPLKQQVERISQVVSIVFAELDNVFAANEKKSLYVHMYADSLVAAEKQGRLIGNCTTKFVEWLLKVQYQILCDSESMEYTKTSDRKRYYMPTLSRGLVRRGEYYGMLFEQRTSINGIPFNFSLVGGPSIVKMDKTLEGLPMGVYIDSSGAGQFPDKSRLVRVNKRRQLHFVKPCPGFDCLRKITQGEDLNDWVKGMIKRSGNDKYFANKLRPWADAVQGRSRLIKAKKQERDRLS